MKLRGAGLWGGSALIVTLLTVGASAQVGGQPNSAEDLYRRGLAAFEAGDYSNACPALAESYRLDPLPGALFTVATCELKAGKIATAFKRFGEFIALVETLTPAQQVQQETRRGVAEQQRRDISVELPYIRVELRGRSSRPAQIYLNGALLGPESIGIEFAVDPGEQLLEQKQGDRAVGTQRVSLAKGERKAVTITLVGEPPVAAPQPPRPAPRPPSHALAYSMMGIGVAGLAVGSGAGFLALRDKGIVNDECHADSCSVKGKSAADSGKVEGAVSTVGFGVGLAGLAIGAFLLFKPTHPAIAAARYRIPVVAITPHAVLVEGVF